MNDEVCPIQLIYANGDINVSGLQYFVKAVKLAECRYSYAVVSIMGAQSSGKSTLLNQLFHTKFREMDALSGRSQTTKGIWLAKCVGIEPTTHGSERGEDDTAFERQSALFALAVSDIVVINMWCHDIGRENAANKPLLRTIFQVMVGLFNLPRKTTLLFVIRDKTETPLELLKADLTEDINEIWKDVPKPEEHKGTPLSDFFRVEVTALPHYKFEKDEFKKQVADLRQKFYRSTAPGGLAGDRQPMVPASGFSLSLQRIWETIRKSKDLDFPAHKVMVATIRCQEISDEKLRQFTADKCWIEIRGAVKSGPVSGFGEKISNLIESYLQEMNDEVCPIQLIYANGDINVSGLQYFVKAVKLAECRYSYAVVSIMGAQSSGKSTLLNQLFHTKFREMDALSGRSQTTKGIWLAKCVGIEPTTHGSERGEDDTAFERQSALFALAVSDIVVINMWCHDIGRENAANKPLLRTIFQVMVGLFNLPRKTTLLFVIRDKTETPLELLKADLTEDINEIWKDVPKPEEHKGTPLSDFFRVEVTALPHYKFEKDEFKKQVADLRQKFYRSTAPGGLAGDRQPMVPASGFSLSLQRIWETIRKSKDLDFPAHKVMVATIRCQEISDEKLRQFTADKCWIEIRGAVKSGPVSGFGEKISNLIESYLQEYDQESKYFDEGVRSETRKQLECGVLQDVRSAYEDILRHLRSKALDTFEDTLGQSLKSGKDFAEAVRDCTKAVLFQFDRGCADAKVRQASCDPSKIREDLERDIDKHAVTAANERARLEALSADHRARLEALSADHRARLEALSADHRALSAQVEELKRKNEQARVIAAAGVASGIIDEIGNIGLDYLFPGN